MFSKILLVLSLIVVISCADDCTPRDNVIYGICNILQYTPNGELVSNSSSLSEARTKSGYSTGDIANFCECKIGGGYLWKCKSLVKNDNIQILQYSEHGDLLTNASSIYEVIYQTGYHYNQIKFYCRKGKGNGYIWKCEEDSIRKVEKELLQLGCCIVSCFIAFIVLTVLMNHK